MAAVQRLLAELEPTGFVDLAADYSVRELPFDGDVLASLERFADGFDWDVVEIEELPAWRDDLASLRLPRGIAGAAFGDRAAELLAALDSLFGEEPAAWTVEMEPRLVRPPDPRGFEALARRDLDLLQRVLAEEEEFEREHPPRPLEPVDYLFLARGRLFLLQLAFTD